MNKWNIPDWLEKEVIERDQICVYCGVDFLPASESRKQTATWEHIINDAKIVTRENIARCCFSCNSSKGAKELSVWLETKYCQTNSINKKSVALVIQQALLSASKDYSHVS